MIAQANDKPTGDDIRKQRQSDEMDERKKFDNMAGRWFSKKQRKRLAKLMEKTDGS